MVWSTPSLTPAGLSILSLYRLDLHPIWPIHICYFIKQVELRYRPADRDYPIAGPFNYSADRLVAKPRSIRWRQVCTADNNDIRRNNDCRSLYRVVIERMIAHQCPDYREYNSCHDKNRCVDFYSWIFSWIFTVMSRWKVESVVLTDVLDIIYVCTLFQFIASSMLRFRTNTIWRFCSLFIDIYVHAWENTINRFQGEIHVESN